MNRNSVPGRNRNANRNSIPGSRVLRRSCSSVPVQEAFCSGGVPVQQAFLSTHSCSGGVPVQAFLFRRISLRYFTTDRPLITSESLVSVGRPPHPWPRPQVLDQLALTNPRPTRRLPREKPSRHQTSYNTSQWQRATGTYLTIPLRCRYTYPLCQRGTRGVSC